MQSILEQRDFPRSGRRDRILIAAVGRTGSSWLVRALGRSEGTEMWFEPDTIDLVPDAGFVGTTGFGPYPIIHPGEDGGVYRSLWDVVFTAGVTRKQADKIIPLVRPLMKLPNSVLQPMIRLGGKVISKVPMQRQRNLAKTILAPFAIEWLVETYDPRVVVTQRHPYSMVASWRDIKLPKFDLLTRPAFRELYGDRYEGEPPTDADSDLTQAAWVVGFLTTILGEAVDRHPEWLVVNHEDMCIDPIAKFQALSEILEIPWSTKVAEYLEASNRPGQGFVNNRISSEEVNKWRKNLSPDEIDEIRSVLSRFPRHGWIKQPDDWESLI